MKLLLKKPLTKNLNGIFNINPDQQYYRFSVRHALFSFGKIVQNFFLGWRESLTDFTHQGIISRSWSELGLSSSLFPSPLSAPQEKSVIWFITSGLKNNTYQLRSKILKINKSRWQILSLPGGFGTVSRDRYLMRPTKLNTVRIFYSSLSSLHISENHR